MSSEANETRKTDAAAEAVAKQAPTEQQESRPGTPKRFAVGQTVCNEKNEKGKLCNGHLKEIRTAGEAAKHLRGDDVLHQCQTCGALYMGPPLGHVRDPRKQQRYVEKDLAAILRAAGGTLPAYDYPVPGWRGQAPRLPKASKAPAATTAAPAPEGETPEQKKARLVAEHKAKLAAKSAPAAGQTAATPEGTATTTQPAPSSTTAAEVTPDSSSAADRHRPAAEAQAATGAASAAPLSPAASTASPAAGAESPSDLSTEASTELTPGAPRDERQEAAPPSTAAPAESAAPADTPAPKPKPQRAASHPGSLPPIAPHLAPPPGETPEQKRERLRLVVEEAKRKAGKL